MAVHEWNALVIQIYRDHPSHRFWNVKSADSYWICPSSSTFSSMCKSITMGGSLHGGDSLIWKLESSVPTSGHGYWVRSFVIRSRRRALLISSPFCCSIALMTVQLLTFCFASITIGTGNPSIRIEISAALPRSRRAFIMKWSNSALPHEISMLVLKNWTLIFATDKRAFLAVSLHTVWS